MGRLGGSRLVNELFFPLTLTPRLRLLNLLLMPQSTYVDRATTGRTVCRGIRRLASMSEDHDGDSTLSDAGKGGCGNEVEVDEAKRQEMGSVE